MLLLKRTGIIVEDLKNQEIEKSDHHVTRFVYLFRAPVISLALAAFRFLHKETRSLLKGVTPFSKEDFSVMKERFSYINLSSLPEGTVGKELSSFVENPDYIEDVIDKGNTYQNPRWQDINTMFAFNHDLHHVICGYKDKRIIGESLALSVGFTHIKMVGLLYLSVVSLLGQLLHTNKKWHSFVSWLEATINSYRISTSFFLLRPDVLLNQNIDEVRKKYNIRNPIYYNKYVR